MCEVARVNVILNIQILHRSAENLRHSYLKYKYFIDIFLEKYLSRIVTSETRILVIIPENG